MPSFYMILHSKIWQWLRWDPDNSKEQPEVINASQQPTSHCVSAERGNGKQREEQQYKPPEIILMKKQFLRIDLQVPGTTYCWSSS